MKSALETLSPTRVKMTVEVPFEELKPSLDAAIKHIGEHIQVPGFRKGKVPARIIEQRVGRAAVLEEAVNNALPTFYGQALEENEVRPLGQPEITDLQVPTTDGEDFVFTAEVDMRPEITLPDFADIELTVDEVKVERRRRRAAPRPTCAPASARSRASTAPCRTATSSPSTCPPRSTASRSTRSPASPTRSAARTCSTVSTRR